MGSWTRRNSVARLSATLRSPTAKRIYAILLVLLVAFLWYNMVRRAINGHGSQYDDFIRFSRDLIFRRLNVYEAYPLEYTITKYPPFFSLLFAPLVPLPTWLGASIWFWASLGLAVAATWLSARTVARDPAEPYRSPALIWLPFLIMAGIIGSNLETSQVNTVTLFVVCLGLYLFRGGRDLPAGAALGVATALKLTPGLFVAYFLYKRAYRVIAGAGLAIVVCWLLIPPFLFGFSNFGEIMVGWYEILTGFVREGTLAEGLQGFRDTNQSLSAAFHRYFAEVPAKWSGGEGSFYINFVSLDLTTADWIVKAIVLVLLAGLAWICRTPLGDRRSLALNLEYSLIWIATLLVSPISWINHYVFLLFPYVVAVYYLRSRSASEPERRRLLWIVIASFVLLVSSASRLMQVYSIPFAGAVVLFVGLILTLRAEQARESTAGVAPGRV